MTGPFATTLFRIAFLAAGAYNLAFGLWAGFFPLQFFELFAIEPPRYPEIWACLGMVVGVYGLLYWHVAWKPETGGPIIAIGLLGKVLGPIGMAFSIQESWPLRLALLNLYNDAIWWLPFTLFLLRGTKTASLVERLAPWICVLLHIAAIPALALWIAPGAATQPEAELRAEYVLAQPWSWSFGWVVWMLSAGSLIGFYAWWGSRLSERRWAIAAVLVAFCGMVCDLSGESLLVFVLHDHASAVAEGERGEFLRIERTATLLTAGAANGLYTLGGLLLTLSTPGLPAWIRVSMYATWLAGAAMSVAGLLDFVPGLVISTAFLFPLFLVWITWLALRWRPS